MTAFQIRTADENDVPIIFEFILRLATYEKMADEVVATEEHVRKTLFGPHPYAFVVLAEVHGVPVGFALYFFNYSTFLGCPGLYLEDLFVVPEQRGNGYGTALLSTLASIAVDNECGRMEWNVLSWNEPAIRFYESLQARHVNEWNTYRLTGTALMSLAAVQDRPIAPKK